MSIDTLLGWLLEGALATSAAMSVVFALRLPLRRLFGAGVAYASWALVPLSLLAVSLPAPVQQAVTRTMRLAPAGWQGLGSAPASALTVYWWSSHGPELLAATWACGALLTAFVFWRRQRHFIVSLGRLRRNATGLLYADAASGCPAVVGAWLPRIVLPADFQRRYPAHEGELVLAHERMHLVRQDTRLNLVAVALRCAHWFNPLLCVAARVYRQDQELACDAAVLARYPNSRRAYADAMLKTQLAVLGLPVGCHWQSSQSLKERILMLKRPLPRRGRARFGAIAVAGLLLAASYATWALQPVRTAQAPALMGTMFEGDVLYADIVARSGPVSVFVVDGAMGKGPEGASRAFSGTDGALKVGLGESPDDPDTLFLVASVSGAQDAPELQWRLERQGRRIDGGGARMQAGQAVTLDIDGARYGGAASATFRIMRATKGVLMGESDERQHFPRSSDGVYVDAHGGSIWAEQYKVAGEAQVIVQVSERGDVVGATVESSNPPGAFTDADARSYFRNKKYAPLIENGVALPARIRSSIKFSPPQEVAGKASSRARPAKSVDGMIASDPPSYPADALMRKQRGKVVLQVLVAKDGSVKDVRVEESMPQGVFDAATVEAARKWKFEPQLENGKPVEGRVRVPVYFEPQDAPAEVPVPALRSDAA